MTESLNHDDIKSSLVEIPFQGKNIAASSTGDSYVVSLRRCCENMGLDYSAQYRRLHRQPWAVVAIMATTGSDGKTYEMQMMSRRTFLMWLATIDTNRVKNGNARKSITAYQLKAAEVLDDYFGADVDKALEQARTQLKRQKGAVTVAKAVGLSTSTISFTELSAILNQAGYKTGRTRFVRQLVHDKFLYRMHSRKGAGKPFPYQKWIERKVFFVGQPPVTQSDGTVRTFTSVRVYANKIPFFINYYAPTQIEAAK